MLKALLAASLLVMAALLAAACGGGDAEPSPTSGGSPSASPSATPPTLGDLSQQQVIDLVADNIGAGLDNHPDRSTAIATIMTHREAEDSLRRRTGYAGEEPVVPPGTQVWLVEMPGEFKGFICVGLRATPCAFTGSGQGTLLQIVLASGTFTSAALIQGEGN